MMDEETLLEKLEQYKICPTCNHMWTRFHVDDIGFGEVAECPVCSNNGMAVLTRTINITSRLSICSPRLSPRVSEKYSLTSLLDMSYS